MPIPRVGRRLDILAVTADERRVAIENQYRSSDHDHLTRGLAYAVGLDASALVVVAEGHRDEFVALADYLNRSSEALGADGIAVFLVSLHVEKVGDYLIPRFDVQARPNSWLAEMHSGSSNGTVSDAAKIRYSGRQQFWTEVFAAAGEVGLPNWANASPGTRYYSGVSAYPGFDITWNMVVKGDVSYPMLWIDTRAVDVDGLGFEIIWDPKERVRSCTVLGESVEGCGWKTPSAERADRIVDLVARTKAFVEVLEPSLAGVVDDATTE